MQYLYKYVLFTTLLILFGTTERMLQAQTNSGRLIIIGRPDSSVVRANDSIISHDIGGWYDVPTGDVKIQIYKRDSLVFTSNMNVSQEQEYKIIFECLIDCANLKVNSTPAGAQLALDGEPQGKTPFFTDFVREGNRTLTLTMPGFATLVDTINLISGQTNELDLTMDRSQAYKDSVKQIYLKKKQARQLVYKIVFGVLSFTAVGVGSYYNKSAKSSMAHADEAAALYDAAREDFSTYREMYYEHKNDADKSIRKRNFFYSIGGISLLGVGLSFGF